MKQNVLGYLLRINRMRMKNLRAALAPYGYTGTMHLIMFYVRRNPGASQDEIAAHYAVDKTGVARDARKLEDLGHIVRRQNPSNRRQYCLELTEKGQEMAEILVRVHDDYDRELSRGIDPGEWEQLRGLLEKVEENACAAMENKAGRKKRCLPDDS